MSTKISKGRDSSKLLMVSIESLTHGEMDSFVALPERNLERAPEAHQLTMTKLNWSDFQVELPFSLEE
jgi:hypothetical protein